MPKIPAEKLEPGMKLTKPVLNKAGMVLLGEGTELTETWVRRIQDMDLTNIYVEGSDLPQAPKEELLEGLAKRFAKVENQPHMALLKRVLKQHIESLYGEH